MPVCGFEVILLGVCTAELDQARILGRDKTLDIHRFQHLAKEFGIVTSLSMRRQKQEPEIKAGEAYGHDLSVWANLDQVSDPCVIALWRSREQFLSQAIFQPSSQNFSKLQPKLDHEGEAALLASPTLFMPNRELI
jgi:hypothetical protein